MKCPKCNTEIEIPPRNSWGLYNTIFYTLVLGGTFSLMPFDVEHGYVANWDMVAAFGAIIILWIYMLLYHYGKVKGRFLFFKKDE